MSDSGTHKPGSYTSRNALPPIPTRLSHVPALNFGIVCVWLIASGATALVFIAMKPTSTPLSPEGLFGVALISPFAGWIQTSALLIIGSAARRKLWPLEPGEWIILVFAWVMLSALAMAIVSILARSHTGEDISGFIAATSLIPLLAAAVSQRRRPWWCSFFATFAGLMLFMIVAVVIERLSHRPLVRDHTMHMVLYGLPTLALLLLVAGLVNDLFRHQWGHWLHWSGIALTLPPLLTIAAIACGMMVRALLT